MLSTTSHIGTRVGATSIANATTCGSTGADHRCAKGLDAEKPTEERPLFHVAVTLS
jgi:hypothetical protein